jgi:hypothetical protein
MDVSDVSDISSRMKVFGGLGDVSDLIVVGPMLARLMLMLGFVPVEGASGDRDSELRLALSTCAVFCLWFENQ